MHLYANPITNYDDDRYRSTDYPLRTELVMEVFSTICINVSGLHNCFSPDKRLNFRPTSMKDYVDRIDTAISMLNKLERTFLDWLMSTGMFYNNKGNMILSITSIRYSIEGNLNLESSKTAVDLFNKCFNVSIISEFFVSTYGDMIHDDCETTGSFTDPDKKYKVAYRNYMDYLFQEFLASYNVTINAKNRDNLKNYRTCDKCGTTFQRSKSRNMHYSKCNGVNKGYYIGKTNEKTSDW